MPSPWFVTILAACLFAVPAAAMPAHEAGPAPLTTIHYRPDGKLMFVQVRVNGSQPAWFCIDSGARHSVIDPRLAAQLRLKSVGEGHTTGVGKGDVALVTLEPVTLGLQGIRVKVEAPYGIDLSHVAFAKDARGLLGFDAFDQYVLRFDPVRHTIAFFDRARFTPPASGTVLPLIVKERGMYLDAKLDVKPGLSVTHRLRIDLGSAESVNDEIVREAAVTQNVPLGGGLSSNFEGISGIYDAVQIGPYQFRHVWGPGAPGPAVGMEIFPRFVSTFDAGRGKLYLMPTHALLEPIPPPPR